MRIAFVTPEFVTDYGDGGGLGNYLHRITALLAAAGHEVELFVASALSPAVFDFDGVRVERVNPNPATWLQRRLASLAGQADQLSRRRQACALAGALERRHAVSPFALVQSADYLGVGSKIRSRPGRVHLVRCSSAADLYNAADGREDRASRSLAAFERAAILRADKAYAPSAFVAAHYRQKHGLRVEALRPPIGTEVAPSAEEPCGLPARFLIHFGQLTQRKGTLWLVEALRLAFEIDPSLRMVWVGRGNFQRIGGWLASLGSHRSKVQVLYPLPKPELYAILQRAEAAVLPSLVDNLPNTVIESLMLGIPVIGTRGASIDELVEPGVNGELVSPSDAAGLADAMVRLWQGGSAARKGFTWQGNIVQEMNPPQAIANLLRFGAAATQLHRRT